MDTETGSSTLTGPEREREIAMYPMFEKKYKTTRRKSMQKINKLMKKSLSYDKLKDSSSFKFSSVSFLLKKKKSN